MMVYPRGLRGGSATPVFVSSNLTAIFEFVLTVWSSGEALDCKSG